VSARIVRLLIAAAVFGALAPLGKAQSVAAPQFSSSSAVSPSASSTQHPLDLAYHRPTKENQARKILLRHLRSLSPRRSGHPGRHQTGR
jgi:hypothetical protein